jgi:hypothetical protein
MREREKEREREICPVFLNANVHADVDIKSEYFKIDFKIYTRAVRKLLRHSVYFAF